MILCQPTSKAIPIYLLSPENEAELQSNIPQSWLSAMDFKGKEGDICLIPSPEQNLHSVLYRRKLNTMWDYADLALRLPPQTYKLIGLNPEESSIAACAWALAEYRFDKFKSATIASSLPYLIWPDGANQNLVNTWVEGITLVRDLINMPPNHLGPEDLADIAKETLKPYKATINVINGKALEKGYPLIYAVGQAAAQKPCLIDIHWQGEKKEAKSLTLIGKGVCFDSGGLNLKTAPGMLLMKKDMGGAAHVLALGQMIMKANLPINLRILIPAVENSINENAMRPSDIVKSRKGITVEIGNTDAEGRLILCDAITAACEENPDLVIDFATLTGAARIALGTELPALFCNQDSLAHNLIEKGEVLQDPLWRLPLFQPYKSQLKSFAADICSISHSSYGGAIHAALFLEAFMNSQISWAHIDLMAWNVSSTPGRPLGGEAMALRSTFSYIQSWA